MIGCLSLSVLRDLIVASFWRHGLSLALVSPNRLDWLASNPPPKATHLYVLSVGVPSISHQSCGLFLQSSEMELGSSGLLASVLLSSISVYHHLPEILLKQLDSCINETTEGIGFLSTP